MHQIYSQIIFQKTLHLILILVKGPKYVIQEQKDMNQNQIIQTKKLQEVKLLLILIEIVIIKVQPF